MATANQTAATGRVISGTSTDVVRDSGSDVSRRDAAASRLWEHLREVLDEAAEHVET